jgi:DNA-binding transcriptional LysR family regulator
VYNSAYAIKWYLIMQDQLSGLTVLLKVAEMRSFSAAAADLKLSPSAVSQSVSALEERLGVRLLARTTRSVRLTEAGERFVARVGPALAEVRAAALELDELRAAPRGVLRVNLSRIACERLIEPRLGEFLQAFPEVSLDLVLDEALVDIVDSGCDVGIRLGEMLDREMVAVVMTRQERMVVVGAPAYFAERGKPKHPRALLEHECINYRQISSRAIYRWEFTETTGKGARDFSVAVPGRIITNDLASMVRAAQAGVGLAYVVESAVLEALKAGSLARVLDAYCPPFPGFFLYYPARRHVPPKLTAFVRFFRAAGA